MAFDSKNLKPSQPIYYFRSSSTGAGGLKFKKIEAVYLKTAKNSSKRCHIEYWDDNSQTLKTTYVSYENIERRKK